MEPLSYYGLDVFRCNILDVIKNCPTENIKHFIETRPLFSLSYKCSAIEYAAELNKFDVVEYFLSSDYFCDDGIYKAFCSALVLGNIEVMNILVEDGRIFINFS